MAGTIRRRGWDTREGDHPHLPGPIAARGRPSRRPAASVTGVGSAVVTSTAPWSTRHPRGVHSDRCPRTGAPCPGGRRPLTRAGRTACGCVHTAGRRFPRCRPTLPASNPVRGGSGAGSVMSLRHHQDHLRVEDREAPSLPNNTGAGLEFLGRRLGSLRECRGHVTPHSGIRYQKGRALAL